MKRFTLNLLHNNKIRKRLIAYCMFITLVMAITSIYTYYNAYMFMLKINSMFQRSVSLNEVSEKITKVDRYLESYLITKRSDSLKEYIRFSGELRDSTKKIGNEAVSSESRLLLKDISNMINTYLYETDAAVNAKRGRNVSEYAAHYDEASKVLNYINIYINKVNIGQMRENTQWYLKIFHNLNSAQILNIVIIIFVTVFNAVLIFWFTYRITKPIISLAKAANEISKGNFEVEKVLVDTNDEISVMANAFNKMTSNIRSHIGELKEKAKLESRLKEQEMQNLVMKNVLKDAELQALQSQINPHFLFNTLNAGAQIAMLEGADNTCVFIENIANLFRYNLRKMDKPVTLREEIDNVNSYIYILKARFADRIEFFQEIDESAIDIVMPCMILQPLIENAFIHGISEMEVGGVITLTVATKGDLVEIVIKDNGKGMDSEIIKEILEGNSDGSRIAHLKTGHTTGIGMNNVINRLRIFFDNSSIMDIISAPGNGTQVVLKLPAATY
ncbi:MAG: sensor histidine kinase [Clostridia bacterium]|nr:sensor histidine kinase [Clostridia bacterium]